jgi:tetratricopeptide (TPR) repeat protein
MRATFFLLILLLSGCAAGVPFAQSSIALKLPPKRDADHLAYVMRARQAVVNEQFSAASVYLLLAQAHNPHSAYLYDQLSLAWRKSSDDKLAERTLKKGLAKFPKDPYLHFTAGLEALNKRDFWAAKKSLTLALRNKEIASDVAPYLLDARMWLHLPVYKTGCDASVLCAFVLEDHGKLRDALQQYLKSAERDPSNEVAVNGAVRMLQWLEQSASTVLKGALLQQPDDPLLYVDIANAVDPKEQGFYRSEALRLTQEDKMARFAIALRERAYGHFEQAPIALAPWLADEDVRIFLAEIQQDQGAYSGCFELLSNVHTARGVFVRAVCLGEAHSYDAMTRDLSTALLLGQHPEEVLAAAVRILENEPKRLQRWIATIEGALNETQRVLLRALLADQTGKPEALTWIEKASIVQNDPGMQLHVIDFQARYGKLQQAIVSLEKLLQQQPNDPGVLNALGFTLTDSRQRLAEAEVYLRRAYRLASYDTAIVDSLGWLFFQQRKFPLAHAWLMRAYVQAPTDPEVAFHLAETFKALGERDKARLLCKKFFDQHPNGILKKRIQCGV